jgi:hypothetical protein
VKLPGGPDRVVLVRIAGPYAVEHVYVAYAREGSTWRRLGNACFLFSKYFEPQHRVVTLGGRSWVVFRVMSGGGTGYLAADEWWYEVAGRSWREVLVLPSDGHQLAEPHHAGRKYVVSVADWYRDAGGEHLRARVQIRFSGFLLEEDRYVGLGVRDGELVYTRAPGRERFELDAARSGMSARELKKLGETDYMRREDYLQFQFENVKRRLTGGSTLERKWLREFLRFCPKTPERAELLRLTRGATGARAGR